MNEQPVVWRNSSTPPTEGLRQRIFSRLNEAETSYLAAESVRRLLDANPELTGLEVLKELEAICKVIELMRETVQCRHCAQLIYRFGDEGTWRHGDPDQSVGCRAASWVPDNGRDETLDRSWKAAPPLHYSQ